MQRRTQLSLTIEPPEVLSEFPVMVPQVDADGNERDGLKVPEVSVPLAADTGWNLFRADSGPAGVLSSMQGSLEARMSRPGRVLRWNNVLLKRWKEVRR